MEVSTGSSSQLGSSPTVLRFLEEETIASEKREKLGEYPLMYGLKFSPFSSSLSPLGEMLAREMLSSDFSSVSVFQLIN